MKKIIVMIFLMIVAVLLLISGVIQYTTMQAAAAMNVFDRSVQDAMRNGCSYSTDPHIFLLGWNGCVRLFPHRYIRIM